MDYLLFKSNLKDSFSDKAVKLLYDHYEDLYDTYGESMAIDFSGIKEDWGEIEINYKTHIYEKDKEGIS